MGKITINALVSGGKASAGPPLGPALGPTGLNIGKVIADINEKTKGFAGIDVPVKVIVDATRKEYEIEVGTPPVSALIKKEIGIEKGTANKDAVAGDITIEQVIKVAGMKSDKLNTPELKKEALQVFGTCVSMGITCGGKGAKEVSEEIKKGLHDALFTR